MHQTTAVDHSPGISSLKIEDEVVEAVLSPHLHTHFDPIEEWLLDSDQHPMSSDAAAAAPVQCNGRERDELDNEETTNLPLPLSLAMKEMELLNSTANNQPMPAATSIFSDGGKFLLQAPSVTEGDGSKGTKTHLEEEVLNLKESGDVAMKEEHFVTGSITIEDRHDKGECNSEIGEMESDSGTSDSETDSSSSSSSSSSEEEDGDEDDEVDSDGDDCAKRDELDDVEEVEEGEIKDFVQEEVLFSSDDEQETGTKGPIKSKNEIDQSLPPVPSVGVVLGPQHQTLPVGVISSIIGSKVIVDGLMKHSPLNEGSILWVTETRSPLGLVDEIFGPVKNPYYVVRYNSEKDVPVGIREGTAVSFVIEFSDHIINDKALYKKGYDASGDNDEELTDEVEFSDDEKEAEYKRSQKQAKRGMENGKPANEEKVNTKKAQFKGAGFPKNVHQQASHQKACTAKPDPRVSGKLQNMKNQQVPQTAAGETQPALCVSGPLQAPPVTGIHGCGSSTNSFGLTQHAFGCGAPMLPLAPHGLQYSGFLGAQQQNMLLQQPIVHGMPQFQQQNLGLSSGLGVNAPPCQLLTNHFSEQLLQQQQQPWLQQQHQLPLQQQLLWQQQQQQQHLQQPQQQHVISGFQNGTPFQQQFTSNFPLSGPLNTSTGPFMQSSFNQAPFGCSNVTELGVSGMSSNGQQCHGQPSPTVVQGNMCPPNQFSMGTSSAHGRASYSPRGRASYSPRGRASYSPRGRCSFGKRGRP